MLRTLAAVLLPLITGPRPSQPLHHLAAAGVSRRTLIVHRGERPQDATTICETYLTITQYPVATHYSTSAAITVEWGEVSTEFPVCYMLDNTDPGTFRFTLNGTDVTSSFSIGAYSATGTISGMDDEATNTLSATITGHDTNGSPRTDTDSKSVYVDTTPAPFLDLSFDNFVHQDVSRCANACFTATYAHTTPAYFSYDTPRNLTLVYHGERLSLRPYVYADVTHPGGTSNRPQKFWLEARIGGVSQTFTNGETRLYFTGSSETVRLGGQFTPTQTSTGVYWLVVTVTSQFISESVSATDSVRLVIDNESGSAVAKGWTVAGVQRLYTQGYGAMITDGAGSAVYFDRTCSNCSYVPPAGEVTTLLASGGSGWIRYYPDSTRVWFDASGRMTQVLDPLGNVTGISNDDQGRPWRFHDPTGRDITLSYGANGLQSITDPMGRTTSITVQSNRTLTAIQDPDGLSTQFGYDGNYRLATVTDRRGAVTTFVYNSAFWSLDSTVLDTVPINGGSNQHPVIRFNPWRTVGVPSGATSSTAFTPALPSAMMAAVTDPENHSTTYAPDRWGQPLLVVSPLGDTTRLTYDGNGLVNTVTRPWGAVDSLSYDARGRITSQRLAGQNATNISYGRWGLPSNISGELQASQQFYINPSVGRIDSVMYAGQSSLRTRYTYGGAGGRPASVSDPGGHTTYVHYDAAFGNRDSVLAPGLRYSRVRLDRYGRDSTSQANGQPWSLTLYDVMNRPSQAFDTVGASPTTLTYDGLLLTRVKDPAGNVYRFAYNALGWLARRYDPADTLNRYDSYGYDRDGRLTSWTNRRGQALSYLFDALDRLVSKRSANTEADTLAYSADYRRLMRSNTYSSDSAYLNANLLADSVVLRIAGRRIRFKYQRNGVGAVLSENIDDPGGVAYLQRRWGRNAGTRLVDTLGLGSYSTSLVRNGELLDTNVTWPTSPGLSASRTYTSLHQIMRERLSDSTVNGTLGRSWAYDSLSRVRYEFRNAPSSGWAPWGPGRSFVYDSLGRLAQERYVTFNDCAVDPQLNGYTDCASVAVDSSRAYSYDLVGNRTDHSGSYAAGNRIQSFAGYSFEHDLDGNVTRKSGNGIDTRYFWSAEGGLDSVVAANGTRMRYGYDTGGRLVRRDSNGVASAVRYFIWDGDQLVAELDASGTQRIAEYSYYPGIDQPLALVTGGASPTIRYFTQDVMGNVTGVTSGSALAQSLLYDAWGVQSASGQLGDTNRLRWKGLTWEGNVTQLYYMRNRWYEPQTGRFLSEDPLGRRLAISGYLFANSDPIAGRDPSGLRPCTGRSDYHYDGWDSVLNKGDHSELYPHVHDCEAEFQDAWAEIAGMSDAQFASIGLLPSGSGGARGQPAFAPPGDDDPDPTSNKACRAEAGSQLAGAVALGLSGLSAVSRYVFAPAGKELMWRGHFLTNNALYGTRSMSTLLEGIGTYARGARLAAAAEWAAPALLVGGFAAGGFFVGSYIRCRAGIE